MRRPRAVREDRALERRVGEVDARPACRAARARSAWPLRARDERVERGDLERRRAARCSSRSRVRRRRPVAAGERLAARRAGSARRAGVAGRCGSRSESCSRRRASGQLGVERRRAELGQQPPRSSPRSALAQRALEIARRRRRRAAVGASAAARTSSAVTSGSPCGSHSSRCAATAAMLAPVVGEQARGLAVQALALGAGEVVDDRGGDQAVREPRRGRSRAGRRRAARRATGASSPIATPASAATTCSGAPWPRMASAAATARSRGGQRGEAPAHDVARDGGDGRRCDRRRRARRRTRAIWRPELVEQPRDCRRRRGGSRGTRAARRRARGGGSARRRPTRSAAAGRRTVGGAGAAEQAQQVRGGASGSSPRAATTIRTGSSLDPPRQVGEHLERVRGRPTGRRRPRARAAAWRPAPSRARRCCGRPSSSSSPSGSAPPSSSRPASPAAPCSSRVALALGRARAAAPRAARGSRRRGSGARSGPGAARRSSQPASRGELARRGRAARSCRARPAASSTTTRAAAAGDAGDGVGERVELGRSRSSSGCSRRPGSGASSGRDATGCGGHRVHGADSLSSRRRARTTADAAARATSRTASAEERLEEQEAGLVVGDVDRAQVAHRGSPRESAPRRPAHPLGTALDRAGASARDDVELHEVLGHARDATRPRPRAK